MILRKIQKLSVHRRVIYIMKKAKFLVFSLLRRVNSWTLTSSLSFIEWDRNWEELSDKFYFVFLLFYRFRVIARGVIPDTSLIFKRRPATDAIAYWFICLFFRLFNLKNFFSLVFLLIWVHFKYLVLQLI